MNVGASVEVVIEKGVFRGLGLARHEGQVVLVRGAYPGERWRVRVAEVARDFARAEPEELLEGGAARRVSPCPYFPDCGGCAHQDLEYEAQLKLKAAVVQDALQRARLPWEREISVAPSPERGWRMRAGLHVAGRGQRLTLGFLGAGGQRVVDTPDCLHLAPETHALLAGLRAELTTQPDLAGRIERVELAESLDGAQRVLALRGRLGPRDTQRVARWVGVLPGLSGVGLVTTEARRGRFLEAAGDVHVRAVIGGATLRAHVLSFFQGNRHLVAALVDEVARHVPGGERLLDLYGGVGLFALPLAARFAEVECVEGDPVALMDARANVRAAAADHVRVVAGDVARVVGALPKRADERVILDPPRSGAGPAVVEAVIARRPLGVTYVSCDPPTLARDLARFVRQGYALESVTALDLFPGTYHIETVAHLARVE